MIIITRKVALIAAPEPPQPPIVFSLVESMGGQWTLSVSSGGLGYGDDLCAYDSEICHEKLDYYDGETLIGTAERDNEGAFKTDVMFDPLMYVIPEGMTEADVIGKRCKVTFTSYGGTRTGTFWITVVA